MGQEELETRERILQTAMAMFMSQGYDCVSIQAIIDAVGIAKGTFYHHYRSKDDLLVEMVDSMTRRILGACEGIIARTDMDARQKFVQVFSVSGAIKMKDLGQSLPLLKQMKTGANQKLEHHLMLSVKRFSRPIFARLLRTGMDEGVFHIRNPEATAEIIMALGMGIREESLDLLIALLEGKQDCLDELIGLFDACNDAIERILGVEAGTLPIYQTDMLTALLPGKGGF